MRIKDQIYQGLRRGTTIARDAFEDAMANTERARTKAYMEGMRRREASRLEGQKKAERLPDTILRFGGRVALVTNFSGAQDTGLNIAQSLVDRGFSESEYLIVDALISMNKIHRMAAFDASRDTLWSSLEGLMPGTEFSSNTHFNEGYDEFGYLTKAVIASKLESSADIAEQIQPGKDVGYVAVVSALELDYLRIANQAGEIGYTKETYEAVRYGGILMPSENAESWALVAHG